MIDQKIKLLKGISIGVNKKFNRIPTKSPVVKAFAALLYSNWKDRAETVIKAAAGVKATEGWADSFIAKADKKMGSFGSAVAGDCSEHTNYLYRSSKLQFIKERKLVKVRKLDDIEIPDEFWSEADVTNIEAIEKHIIGSTGKFYEKSSQRAITESVKKNIFERGLVGDELVEAVMSDVSKALHMELGSLASEVVPEGFRGLAEEYFKGISEHVATLTRTGSIMEALSDSDVQTFVIRSMQTDRTCIGCLEMDGETFEVEKGYDHFQSLVEADDEEQMAEIQPSFHFGAPGENSEDKLAELADLADAGVMLPPFHFRCECYVDME